MNSLTELNWGILESIYLGLVFLTGLLVTYLVIPPLIKFMKKKGYVGKDIHKKERPEVAESGGLSMIIGFTAGSVLLLVLFPIFINEILVVLYTVGTAGIIGYVDDRIRLRSRYKILLTLITGGAIFVANYFGYIDIVSPVIPFLGRTRLTILYPFAAPIIVAVFCNATNMLEGYNGEGSGTGLIATIFVLICAIILNSALGLIFSLLTLSVIIPFFLFNKYPAKIFPGDIGTLGMGAMFACIALFGSLEVIVFCAFLLHIFNGFYVLSSVRGFFESSELLENKSDIFVTDDDKIVASDKKDAALSLPRLIAAKGPISEKKLVNNFYTISLICGFIAIIAALFTSWTLHDLSIIIIIITLMALLLPTSWLIFQFPRIQGVIALMVLLLVAGILVLIFADTFIMPIEGGFTIPIIEIVIPLNMLIIAAIIAPGLLVWYLITIKYFWYEINKMKKKDV